VKLFIYEMVCGGGATLPADCDGELAQLDDFLTLPALVADGSAMLLAVAQCCQTLPAVEIVVTVDSRLESLVRLLKSRGVTVQVVDARDPWSQFLQVGRDADKCIVIAPELNSLLSVAVEKCNACGCGKLIGPDQDLLAIGVDKVLLHHWADIHEIRMPDWTHMRGGNGDVSHLDDTLVLKPINGTGGIGMRKISSHGLPSDGEWLVEEFVRGESYSVSAIFHQDGFTMVPPWRQELGGADGFEYVGGSICDDENVIERLNAWAVAVFNSLPRANSRGWISLDAIVAVEEIYLIEVNPRITASFDSLCELASFVPYQELQSTNVTELMSAAIWGNERST
jgi:predicted ATP-grasp superfamily ATP-dependent carboligase